MNAPVIVGLQFWTFVYDFAENVDDATESAFADRNRNWFACVGGDHASGHTVGGAHRDAAHAVVTEQELHFADNFQMLAGWVDASNYDGVVDFW